MTLTQHGNFGIYNLIMYLNKCHIEIQFVCTFYFFLQKACIARHSQLHFVYNFDFNPLGQYFFINWFTNFSHKTEEMEDGKK